MVGKHEDAMKLQTCVLKVNIQCHCDGCKSKIRKLLQKIDVLDLAMEAWIKVRSCSFTEEEEVPGEFKSGQWILNLEWII
ncbi:hypothetical protein LINPERPRIM_LOCUS34054 [Linum perenne]